MSGSLRIANDRDAIHDTSDHIVQAAARAGFSEASRFAVRLAVEEAIANAFRHGHKDLDESVPVSVDYEVDEDEICVSVEDAGPGFSPDDVPDPTAPENITKPSGRGLLLVKSYMNEVRHNERGNRIEMRYRRPK